ncbi:MAG TPA: hypothetical protein VGV09_19210 [Steroidobacteraceae bacterium]|nr:hypothetical protein [Steroidobacteraceae bacterium]
MGLIKASGARLQRRQATALSTYQVGQRTVQLFELADGHIQWVCNCEDYGASTGLPQGAWCKHVAKASAIRSIERLTGARAVGRTRVAAATASVAPEASPEVPRSSLANAV